MAEEPKSLWTFQRAAEHRAKEKQQLEETKQAYACPNIDAEASRQGNMPICRFGKTYCDNAYDSALILLCPTKTFHERWTLKC